MNIVERAIKRHHGQQKLADLLTEATGHPYKPGHIAYWKKVGGFPAELAIVVCQKVFDNEITMYEASPSIKRPVATL